jgi:hypothetical protein
MPLLVAILHNPLYLYELFALTSVYPAIRIFQRAGLQPAWAILLPVPVLGLLACLGMLALCKWEVKA